MADISGVWPREQPRPTGSKGEILVYDELRRGMPEGWVAWHSLKIRSRNGWDGEGDFVLAVPDRGLVVLEVKNGRIEIHDGRWLQNGMPMGEDPRTQVQGFARMLADRLHDQGCHAPFGVATMFPETWFDNDPTQDDMRDTTFGAHDLPHLTTAIEKCLGRIIPANVPAPRGDWIGTLHRMWCETWVPQVSLGTRFEVNEERRVQMDASQRQLLDKTEKTRLALIYGLAGSGKTFLAREKAIHAHGEGRKVKVLCFTDPLAANLRVSIPCQDILVKTVRAYASEILVNGGVVRAAGDNPEYWDSVSRRVADLDLVPAGGPTDMIIVDEAQDLSDGDWTLVKKLVGEGGCWAFCDMTQRYWPDRKLPDWLDDGWVYDLETVYRCPPSIMALARAVAGLAPDADGSLPGGCQDSASTRDPSCIPTADLDSIRQGLASDEIRIIQANSAATVTHAVETEVARLLKAGVEPGDIAVVSLAGQTADNSILTARMLAGKTVLRASNPNANNRLVADTFLRFKGLERPAVIVTDLHLRSDERLPTRLYIAMTRAQDCLRLVVAPGDMDKIPVLRQVLQNGG